MKWFDVIAVVFVVSAICADARWSQRQNCNEAVCVLPNCRCSSTNIPGGLRPRDVPQFVTVTFNSGVNVNNFATYREVLFNRVNSNGCRAGSTFFVLHEYTNYELVNQLYNRGYEIALNSMTHRSPQSYWSNAPYADLVRELVEQKTQISHFASIPFNAIQGIRLPYLQMSGNTNFQMMADYGLKYDSSWSTVTYTDPALWPYTLDYPSTQDCVNPPCPTASIPGPWVAPIVTWSDLRGVPCATVDACIFVPRYQDENAWYQFFLTNFERHYFGNRAPFPFFVNEVLLSVSPQVRRAFVRFLDLLNNLNDVFMVNMSEVIEWVENPLNITEYRQKSCPTFIPTTCNNPRTCVRTAPHNGVQYYMTICNVCPRVYPWIGNPLGQ